MAFLYRPTFRCPSAESRIVSREKRDLDSKLVLSCESRLSEQRFLVRAGGRPPRTRFTDSGVGMVSHVILCNERNGPRLLKF